MEVPLGGHGYGSATQPSSSEEELVELRKGPWTVEEDTLLANYVSINGEGRWNSLARHAGLKRTGKSCRLRWLNYLRPSVRRGNITLQEQLLILELHSRWGNRWSKIAQYLPGRTDNEIKNYWRTRVQKQAKQLKCDVNSKQFQDAMRFVWIPRLIERIQAGQPTPPHALINNQVDPNATPDVSASSSSETSELQPASSISELTESQDPKAAQNGSGLWEHGLDMEVVNEESKMNWVGDEDSLDNLWISDEDIWFLQQQLYC